VPYAPRNSTSRAADVNENRTRRPEAVLADIAAAVTVAARTLNRYPDRDAVALRTDLAAYLGPDLSADEVWAANGSNEIMLQLLSAFGGPGRTALSFAPTYSMYPEYARDTHTDWTVGQRREDFTVDPETRGRAHRRAGAVGWYSSPRPTTPRHRPAAGRHRGDLRGGSGMVVVDEAYAEFRRTGTPSALSLLPSYPRLVITRTMSKAFALAGGRLGYLAAAPAVVDAVRIVGCRITFRAVPIDSAASRPGRSRGSVHRDRADLPHGVSSDVSDSTKLESESAACNPTRASHRRSRRARRAGRRPEQQLVGGASATRRRPDSSRKVIRQPDDAHGRRPGGSGEIAEPPAGQRERLAHRAGDDQPRVARQQRQRARRAGPAELGVRLVDDDHARSRLADRLDDVSGRAVPVGCWARRGIPRRRLLADERGACSGSTVKSSRR